MISSSFPEIATADKLKSLQQDILVAIARGRPLGEVMTELCRQVETLSPDAVCSIIRVDDNGRLRPLAGPSLPDHYSKAIDGVPVGPSVGSCGTAAFLGKPVEVVDIATDPLWSDFRDYALAIGLRACWSSPIFGPDGRVMGTFAFYSRTSRGASDVERRVVHSCVDLCSIAIEQWEVRERINRLALHDPLTGLGNRAMLKDRLSRLLDAAGNTPTRVSILYLDLDGFKAVNDLHGHGRGDELLCQIARKLSATAERADLIARLGGDEFLLVHRDGLGGESSEELAARLVAKVSGRYTLEQALEVNVGVSIGVARFPEHGTDLSALMAHADTALYRVKNRGGGGFALFEAEMEQEQLARRALERDVSRALEAGQLTMVYQPQADAQSSAVVGFEALMRWKHPQRGWVSPAEFIPAAEACGAINEMGAFALREACREAATWASPLRIAVNVSPAQIVLSDFAGLVERILAETGLDATRLEVEVTESLFIRDSNSALQTLQRLQSIGVTVAIDDFGTGYSSLSTLRSFPFDRIKIDRSFVSNMTRDGNDAAIVNSLLGLGRAMGLRVVAEGVETLEQVELLRMLGCNYLQGYLIGKPLPISAFAYATSRAPARREVRAGANHAR